MEDSYVGLSAPLQQLKDEHVSLREEMELFYEITEEIQYESGPFVIQQFYELYKCVSAFAEKLEAHSAREEDWLFPMMVRHLGENDRTIERMESEHEKAKQHLHDFLSEAEKKGQTISEHDVLWITVYAVQAHATLTQHFANEEKVLFPLAGNILTAEEMEELNHCFRQD